MHNTAMFSTFLLFLQVSSTFCFTASIFKFQYEETIYLRVLQTFYIRLKCEELYHQYKIFKSLSENKVFIDFALCYGAPSYTNVLQAPLALSLRARGAYAIQSDASIAPLAK